MAQKKPIKFNVKFQSLLNREGVLCSEIQLFKLGTFVHWSGIEFEVNHDFMESMVQNFDAMVNDSKDTQVIPIDYNHGSLEYGADESKAAGWISKLNVKEDGLYAEVEWTDAAKAMIKDKEFRYISPEFATEYTDEFGEDWEGPVLFAGALTNRPFLKGMNPVSLKDRAGKQRNSGGSKMKDKLIKLFSLGSDADEDKIVSAAESSRLALTEIEGKLKCKEGEAVTAIDNLCKDTETLKANLKKTADELVQLKDKTKSEEAARKVKAAMEAGKIVKAAEEKWLKLAASDPETFDSLVADLVPVVDMEAKGKGGENKPQTDNLHEATMKLCEENPKLTYLDAYEQVKKQHPELVKAHINRSGKHPHLDS